MKAQTDFVRLEPGSQARCWADAFTARGELDQCERMATHIECQLSGATYGYWCDTHTKQRRAAQEAAR